MKSTDIPTKFPIPFGNGAAAGTIRVVPQASQTSIDIGQASLTDGFPTATGQPLASGGKPPSMQDFNGLFNQITAWSRWQNAGGLVPYDNIFSSAIGGYPAGAVLASTTPGLVWLNTLDNNTTNPDGNSAAGWISVLTGANAPTVVNNIVNARPAVTTVWIDPANGSEGNTGTTASQPRKSIDAVISGMNSNATLINLIGDTTMRQRINVLAPLTIQGVDTAGNFVARTLSFLGTADNSGGALGTTCSGMFFNGPLLRTGFINYFLPDIPTGYNYRSHIISLGNSAASIGSSVVSANSAQSGALFGFQNARLTVTVTSMTISAALGHVFDGIGANGNPNGLYNYTTNITSA